MAKEVIIYSSTGCASCHREKAWLSLKRVAFTDKNVAESATAMEELQKLGFLTVPVTVVDGEVIAGFQPERLARALALE